MAIININIYDGFMIKKYLNYSKNLTIKDFGQLSFYLSAFFLVSALPISVPFLLISIIIYFKECKLEFLKDKASYLLIICSFIIILSSLNSTLNLKNITLQSDLNVWIGIFNWVPLFAVFIISKFYLKEYIKEKFL